MKTTNKSFTKKIIAIALAIMTLTSTFAMSTISAQAAAITSVKAVFAQVTKSKPMKTFISSDSEIPCYTDKTLKVRGTETSGKSKKAHIDPTDDVQILATDAKLKWAKVSYPEGGKRYTAYVSLKKFTAANGNFEQSCVNAKVKVYRNANKKTAVKGSYVSKNTTAYLVAKKGSFCQIAYKSNNCWFLVWVSKSDYDNHFVKPHQHSFKLCIESSHPHREYKKCSCGKVIYTGKTVYNYSCKTCNPAPKTKMVAPMKDCDYVTAWGQKVSYVESSNNANLGIDCAPKSDKNVYAVSGGTVVKKGFNVFAGNFVIIKHEIDGKTVFSFYAHLKSINAEENKVVEAGTKIGIVGKSGVDANGIEHLHFAFISTCDSPSSFWGYATAFVGNKTEFNGVTFYNPTYVINYGKLPK